MTNTNRMVMSKTEEMRQALQSWGFTVGPRDSRVNTNYPGAFMVIESHEDSELPTQDGRNGPWAIVGDDLNKLVREAYTLWEPEYPPGTIPSRL